MQVSSVARSKAEAAAAYDRMSRFYDLLAGYSERRLSELGLQKLAPHGDERLLEIGAGTGRSLVGAAKSAGYHGDVCGIDISRGMLGVTRARIRGAGVAERVHLARADGAGLPFAADSFDAIFMSFTLELFDGREIAVVLHECRRVLRSSGRICVVAMSKRAKAGPMVKLYEWAHHRFPRYVDCRPIYLQQALEEAAFRVIDVTNNSLWGLPVAVVVARKHGEEPIAQADGMHVRPER